MSVEPVMSNQAFYEMPGHIADEVAAQPWVNGRELRFYSQGDTEFCRRVLLEEYGVPVYEQVFKFIHRLDNTRAGWIALQNVTPTGEAELVALMDRGLWHRSLVLFIAHWIFCDLKVRRLVLRIPEHDGKSQDYARRLGFRYEGRAREYFRNGQDASVWIMFARDCRWLPHGGPN